MKYSEKELQAILSGQQSQPSRPSKYRNVKTAVNDVQFDSVKESKHYLELMLMERAGLITDLELQPVFILQEKLAGMRAIKYVADFRWVDVATGKTHVKDSKGFQTAAFRIKAKLFKAKFPDLIFEVG